LCADGYGIRCKNMANERGGYAAIGKNGTYDGEIYVCSEFI